MKMRVYVLLLGVAIVLKAAVEETAKMEDIETAETVRKSDRFIECDCWIGRGDEKNER